MKGTKKSVQSKNTLNTEASVRLPRHSFITLACRPEVATAISTPIAITIKNGENR